MSKLPAFAMHVADVNQSIAFYQDHLGFTLVEVKPDTDMAIMLDVDNDLILLAGPTAGDLTLYLAEDPWIANPGELVNYLGGDLESLRVKLQQRGIESELKQSRFGDQELRLNDPDGYIIGFVALAHGSPEESLALYERMPTELDTALSGLSDADLDLSKQAGEWGIRQIVHHLADSDVLFMNDMRASLLAPGKLYKRNILGGNEVIPETSDYVHRAVEPSIELSRAIHGYVAQLARHVQDAWERASLRDGGSQISFGQWVTFANRHTAEHLEEIYEIRQIHGK